MDKSQAEQILGLKGAYTQKDLARAYRKKVKLCHPDVGGTDDEMARVNLAEEYLYNLFEKNGAAILTCESARKPHANEARRDERPQRQEPAQREVVKREEAEPVVDHFVDAKEAEKNDGPRWYVFATRLIARFPWRLAFIVIVGYFGFNAINFELNSMFDGFDVLSELVILLLVILFNTITGLFTNWLRAFLLNTLSAIAKQ